MSESKGNPKVEAIRQAWQQRQRIRDRLSGVRNKVAVYSGKGGVGKTTIAVNLACLLAWKGHRVGVLDADIDCPNVARVLRATEPPVQENGKLIPSEAFGVKVVSMAFFQPNEEEAIIWRGPMIHKAITELLEATEWGEMEFLFVDLPPGTSDAPLTVMQTLPLDGFVVVTTPQELALLDAKRSVNMVRKMDVKVLGVVENFEGEVFGSGAGEELARELDVPFLGSFSLRPDYRNNSGPTVLVSEPVRREYEAVLAALRKGLENLKKG